MRDRPTVGGIVVEWHRSVLSHDDGATRATRARLRRCELPADALIIEATHDLNSRLEATGIVPSADQLALLATTFARLKGTHGYRLAALFGTKTPKDGPRPLSELRFQALIRVRSHRELITPLRRSLAVLGPDLTCNGRALADDLFWWNDKARNSWCFQYFGAGFAADTQGEIV